MAELCLLDVDDLAGLALGAPMLSNNPAGQAFRGPVTLLQNRDGSTATLQAQKFPSARSYCFAEAFG
jgi:hypothetical protein